MVHKSDYSAKKTHDAALAARLPATATVVGGSGAVVTTKYSPETMAAILDRVAAGETIKLICREPGMPSVVQLRRWILGHPDLRDAWATARQLKAGAVFDEAIELARELATGSYTQAQVSAIRGTLEHLRWAAAKLSPTEFGDRQPNVPTLAIQINTTLDLGQGNKAGDKSGTSVYKLEIPLGDGQQAQEAVIDVPIRRQPGRRPKKRNDTVVEAEYEHVSTSTDV